MKTTIATKLITCLLLSSFVLSIAGCANGPIRRFLQKRGAPCNTCQPPSTLPPVNTAPGCNNCGEGVPAGSNQPRFDGYSSNYPSSNFGSPTGDPYYGGSNIDNATINPTYGDVYGNGNLGNTIVPPINVPLPHPNGR